LIREIVRVLPGAITPSSTLVDLGCGTGAAGAAWAAVCHGRPQIIGLDLHPWALAEAARTYRAFGLSARTRRIDVATARLPPAAILAAFTVNELADAGRDALLTRLLDCAADGSSVLIVEPVARFVSPWWNRWREAFATAGGRDDEWRIRVELPPIVDKLDRAAGMHHRELKARSLWLQGTEVARHLA
jgi:trans-aconitate methyltransferase